MRRLKTNNMKKYILLASVLLGSTLSYAQKAKIQDALNYLKDKDVPAAKKAIDEATANESTASSAKAWLIKGVVYQAISTPAEMMPSLQFIMGDKIYDIDVSSAASLKASTPNADQEAINAYKKSIALDPKYDKNSFLPLLSIMGIVNFNAGVNSMNKSNFNEAMKAFQSVVDLGDIDGGKLWKGLPQVDTLVASSRMYKGNCAFQLSKDDEAISILEECIKSPITQTADVYVMLSDIYERKNDDTKWLALMKEAKAKFPSDKRIINNEINYYLKKGKGEESIAKLKEGIAAEPNRTDLLNILGQTYYNMANPEKGARPANAKELEQNALQSYTKAAEINPKDIYSQYYLGQLYYNQAKNMTDEMNKADDKTYEKMKPQRDELLNKSLPYLEKARGLAEAEGISDSNKEIYKSSLMGLEQAYRIMGNEEKSTEYSNLNNKVK